MNEPWARVAIVVGALAIAGIVVLVGRRRARRPVRSVKSEVLGAGVYFFSSTRCPTCAKARQALQARLGEQGYTEFVWEDTPQAFADLGVDAVPAVVILDDDGRGRIYFGQPDRALSRR